MTARRFGSRQEAHTVVPDSPGDHLASFTRNVDARSLERVASHEVVDRIELGLPACDQTDEHVIGCPRKPELTKRQDAIRARPRSLGPFVDHRTGGFPSPLSGTRL